MGWFPQYLIERQGVGYLNYCLNPCTRGGSIKNESRSHVFFEKTHAKGIKTDSVRHASHVSVMLLVSGGSASSLAKWWMVVSDGSGSAGSVLEYSSPKKDTTWNLPKKNIPKYAEPPLQPRIFLEIDKDHSGELSFSEFEGALSIPKVRCGLNGKQKSKAFLAHFLKTSFGIEEATFLFNRLKM